MRHFLPVPFLLLAIVAALLIDPPSSHARAVSLSDSVYPPTYLVYLYPHASVTFADVKGYNCPHGGYFSDVSAYSWHGRALGAQRHTTLLDSWRNRTGRVTFDGITFRNASRSYVLVAGWCG